METEKLEEIVRNPKVATAKNLLVAISKEIINPEMAAFASSCHALAKRLQRRLNKISKCSEAIKD